MLNLDKTWFESTHFLFLWPETFEYIQKQIVQGYYVDDSMAGYLRPASAGDKYWSPEVMIDGTTYKDNAQALSSLKLNANYTLHEVRFGNAVEYEVRRNIRMFDVSCIDDIVEHLDRIEMIHNQKVDACVKRDLEFIRLYAKKKRKDYGQYLSSFVKKCQMESEEGKKAKERNKELVKQNSELRSEIKTLMQKLKTLDAQGDVQKMKKCAGDVVDTLLKAAASIKKTYLADE